MAHRKTSKHFNAHQGALGLYQLPNESLASSSQSCTQLMAYNFRNHGHVRHLTNLDPLILHQV